MKNVARDHHFVPQCYLAGFTDSGTKKGRLCVYDFKVKKFFRQRPKGVAFEVDFNRVEWEGHPPDVLEHKFGDLERHASSAIRLIIERQDIPEDEDFSYVLNLIALLAVRHPAMRRSMTASRRHVHRIIGGMLAADRQLYESHLRRARAGGFISSDQDVPFEEMRDFLRADTYELHISPQEHLQQELAIFQDILNNVADRTWSLFIAAPEAPDFITCDRPVSLVFNQLVFPINARHALVGDREGRAPVVGKLQAPGVAEVNSRLLKLCDRQIYCRTQEAAFLYDEGVRVSNLADLDQDYAALFTDVV